MQFRNFQHQFDHPFSCFVDFESTLTSVNKRDDQHEVDLSNATQYYQKHEANSFGIKYNCIHEEHSNEYKEFMGMIRLKKLTLLKQGLNLL